MISSKSSLLLRVKALTMWLGHMALLIYGTTRRQQLVEEALKAPVRLCSCLCRGRARLMRPETAKNRSSASNLWLISTYLLCDDGFASGDNWPTRRHLYGCQCWMALGHLRTASQRWDQVLAEDLRALLLSRHKLLVVRSNISDVHSILVDWLRLDLWRQYLRWLLRPFG